MNEWVFIHTSMTCERGMSGLTILTLFSMFQPTKPTEMVTMLRNMTVLIKIIGWNEFNSAFPPFCVFDVCDVISTSDFIHSSLPTLHTRTHSQGGGHQSSVSHSVRFILHQQVCAGFPWMSSTDVHLVD